MNTELQKQFQKNTTKYFDYVTLFGWYRFAVETGEWGPYEALNPTQKFTIWLRHLWGGGACGE